MPNTNKMKEYLKALVKDYTNVTVGKVYEGEVSPCGNYFQFRDDNGDSSNFYVSRFERVSDVEHIKLLEAELLSWESNVMKIRDQKVAVLNSLRENMVVIAGQRYRLNKTGHEYIVVLVSRNEYCLCSLQDGNRWATVTNVAADIFDGGRKSFTRI